uniref:20-oxo-5-O-mycaminosyltylactone 23-monooxygenase n=2 Tax=Streptomyces fradiae TaxID=1906 RepID=TYLH1_STRFR|nr:RecName: Full=20-oxo-5-O-mycaminosyltylactone 23-monooxygenase; AltName: Full=Cytochrome P-450 monooxygenase TylH1 [Streptomyces fradiae]
MSSSGDARPSQKGILLPAARANDTDEAAGRRSIAWPVARTCPFSPPEQYAALRAEEPIARAELWDGAPVWLISRQDHVRALLADPRVSIHPAKLPRLSPSDGEAEASRSLLTLDPPDHGALRGHFIPEFGLRRVRELRPSVEQIVTGLLDDLTARGDEADLLADFALPMATQVICRLLDIPYEDRDYFQERTEQATRPAAGEEALEALLELRDYLDRLISGKTGRESGDGMLGSMVAQARGGGLSHADVLDNAVLLLAAGHETTASMVTMSVLVLLQHPTAWRELTVNPGLLPGAVDELLRYLSIADGLRRSATADIEIDGHTIRAGDGLVFLLAAANRDEAVFSEPEAFDIHRSARRHVAFGYGPHQCLGQNLARMELEVALGAVLERLPALRPTTDVAGLRLKSDSAVFGVYELPVAW